MKLIEMNIPCLPMALLVSEHVYEMVYREMLYHAQEYFRLHGAGNPGYPIHLHIEYHGDYMRILNEETEVLCYSKLSGEHLDEPEVFDVSFTNTVTLVVDQGYLKEAEDAYPNWKE